MISPDELREIRAAGHRIDRRVALKQSIGFLNLCLGRMRACREENPNAHAVSVDELPRQIAYLEAVLEAWVEDETMDMPSPCEGPCGEIEDFSDMRQCECCHRWLCRSCWNGVDWTCGECLEDDLGDDEK